MYMYMRFPGGKYKAVTFSYDDGFRTDIRLAQTLDKYGLKGTFNINNGYISEDPEGKWMTADDIRTHILDKGHEVANHGHHHWSVCSHRPIEALRDMLRCRLELEEKFGGFIRGMATPDNGLDRFDNGSDRILQGFDAWAGSGLLPHRHSCQHRFQAAPGFLVLGAYHPPCRPQC